MPLQARHSQRRIQQEDRNLRGFASVFRERNLEQIFSTHEIPSTKSVRYCFHRPRKKRRKSVRDNELLSGNLETETDFDVQLDNLILEKD